MLILAGLAGTLWCHFSMGDAWRIGVREGEKTLLVTRGPYRFIRHPLYSFQRLLIAAKIIDEERHMANIHGFLYKEYKQRTGSLWPKA